jgi:gamma-glutamyltranspeptidase / glutathione hydrolase
MRCRTLVISLGIAAAALRPDMAAATEGSRFTPVVQSRFGAVASESMPASRAGIEVLEKGGNAVDAAVTAAFALGVTLPQLCGLGARGFLLYRSARGAAGVIDFDATAPAAMTATTLGTTPDGIDQEDLGRLVVGVPGTVAGLATALEKLGTISLRQAIAPAEKLAREGFPVGAELAAHIAFAVDSLRLFPNAAAIMLKSDGTPYAEGEILVQSDYARSLRLIAALGPRGFYRGPIARLIVQEMKGPGTGLPGDVGILTAEDLATYRPIWRAPLVSSYRGKTVLSAPPPADGVEAIEALNILERFDVGALGASSVAELHLMAEAQKMALVDAETYVADPAFTPVPTSQLTSKSYAEQRAALFDPASAQTYSPGLGTNGNAQSIGGTSTTHVSVLDRWGNAVSLTFSLGLLFGSGVVPAHAGFFLNEIDFDLPGFPDEAAGGKRPAVTHAPTIVTDGNGSVLVVGVAGGGAIPQAVVSTIVNVFDFGMDPARAVDAERIRCFEDLCLVEGARISPQTLDTLSGYGHDLVDVGEYGDAPAVGVAEIVGLARDRMFSAAADPRGDQGALGVGSPPHHPGFPPLVP